jgi:hypothetical protein
MNPMWRLAVLTLLFAACSPSPSSAGSDAGNGLFDAGLPSDAGTVPDAGSETDAGPLRDAGSSTDAGPPGNEQMLIAETEALVGTIARAVARERTDTGSLTMQCLTVLMNLTATAPPAACAVTSSCATAEPGYPCWGGPYVSSVPPDPWGHALTATLDASSDAVTVRSDGPDGAANTADDITATD